MKLPTILRLLSSVPILLAGCGPREEPPEVRIEHLCAALREGSLARRTQAARQLAAFGSRAAPAAPDLVRALADPELRFVAMATLSRIGKGAVPALVAGLGSDRVAPHARETLRAFGESVLATLLELARTTTGRDQRQAIEAMLELGPSAATGLVQLAEDPRLRGAVEHGLRRLDVVYLRALLAALVPASEDTRRFVVPRIWPQKAFAGLPTPEEVIPELANPQTHESAAIALAAMGPKAVPKLLPLLGVDPFREGAAYALELMGPGIIGELERAATDPVHAERRERIRAILGRIRTHAKRPG